MASGICEGMDSGVKHYFFEEMLRLNVIFIEENFKSSAGYNLPFYGDFRRLISSPTLIKRVGEELARVAKREGYDVLAGASMSADAWTASASIASEIPCILLRKEPHYHGDNSVIVGCKPKKDARIVLIEDGVASAGQAKKFIENMEKEGYQVRDILAVFDVMEGEGEKDKYEFLNSKGITFRYLFKFREFFDFAEAKGMIPSSYKEIILDWAQNPATWGEGSEKWNWYNEEKSKGAIWITYS